MFTITGLKKYDSINSMIATLFTNHLSSKSTMRISLFKIYMLLGLLACNPAAIVQGQSTSTHVFTNDASTINGAERTEEYLPLLKNKKVAIVANHTSMVENTHLVDMLLSLKVNIVQVFAPEHGFRGIADAGEKVTTSTDEKTGLPIVSLYGKNKKPTADQLKDVDIVLFDIQDVGARFYTYISTMTYVMEACAENKKKLIVLDRPNPNGHYVDGPVLNSTLKSFVGMHPVPIVHGMTVGEYAQMVNGEKWLTNGVECDLQVVTVKNYDHLTFYTVPIAPSPNLKTMEAIYLYPTTCLFEGTDLSVGRGTEDPFTVVGHPDYKAYTFNFTPKSMPGAKSPKFMDKKCFGINFATDTKYGDKDPLTFIHIIYLVEMYRQFPNKENFFTSFFDQLVGNTNIKQMIIDGKSETTIQSSWKKEVDDFKLIRKKYLLYTDFE
jgi:uncharacterized protein YbbC (DUF1343 family)